MQAVVFDCFNKKKQSGSTDTLQMHTYVPQIYLLIHTININYVQFYTSILRNARKNQEIRTFNSVKKRLDR